MFRSLARTIHFWLADHTSKQDLENMPDRTLAEIGIHREDIPFVVRDTSRKTQVALATRDR